MRDRMGMPQAASESEGGEADAHKAPVPTSALGGTEGGARERERERALERFGRPACDADESRT